MAADGSITGKRKAEGDSLEENDAMGLPTLKRIKTINVSCAQIENCVEDRVLMEKNEGCETPRSEEHKIPPWGECPPAPRKPKPVVRIKPATIPGGFFFVPPNLESVFFPYRIRPRKKLHWSSEPAWIGVSIEENFI